MTIDINNLRRLALDGDLAAMQAIIIRLERTEKERDALRAKIARMEKTWLSPEGYHILMQEREDMLFQAEKMKQHTPCKDISMWPTHHTQPTQPAPSVPEPINPVSRVRDHIKHAPNYVMGWNDCRAAMLAAAPEAKP